MVRPARHEDIPALMELITAFFANGELDGTGLSLDLDTLEFFIQDTIDLEDRAVFVVEDNGRIIGAIAGGVQGWYMNADITVLVELGWFIPKEYRASHPKAAIQLLRSLKEWGKGMGATVLNISSTKREESPRVVQFYEKMGLQCLDKNYVGKL